MLLAVVFTSTVIAVVLAVVCYKKRPQTHTSPIQVDGSLHSTPEEG